MAFSKFDVQNGNLDNLNEIFLIMEFGGSDLSKLLENVPNNELNENHILAILYNLLCGINFIHSAKIIHRDMTPPNILIDEDCQVKICDFGFARTMPLQSHLNYHLVKYRNQLY